MCFNCCGFLNSHTERNTLSFAVSPIQSSLYKPPTPSPPSSMQKPNPLCNLKSTRKHRQKNCFSTPTHVWQWWGHQGLQRYCHGCWAPHKCRPLHLRAGQTWRSVYHDHPRWWQWHDPLWGCCPSWDARQWGVWAHPRLHSRWWKSRWSPLLSLAPGAWWWSEQLWANDTSNEREDGIVKSHQWLGDVWNEVEESHAGVKGRDSGMDTIMSGRGASIYQCSSTI